MELELENDGDVNGSKTLSLSITHNPDRSYLIEVHLALLLMVYNKDLNFPMCFLITTYKSLELYLQVFRAF